MTAYPVGLWAYRTEASAGTLANMGISPKVSFLAPHATHTAGHLLTFAGTTRPPA